jgi:hypothetical protein
MTTTVGQVTGNDRHHHNVDGTAACGAGKIIASTVLDASDPAAHSSICNACRPSLDGQLTLDEAIAGIPQRGGYRIRNTRDGLLVIGGFGTGWSCAVTTSWRAMMAARRHRGKVVAAERAEKAAKAAREQRAATAAAAGRFYCRECGGRLSDFDLTASAVEGVCFDCC